MSRLYPKTDHNLFDWEPILKSDDHLWENAKNQSLKGPCILMATSVGGMSAFTTIESLLAVALTLRGAKVHVLLCDHSMPACMHFVVPNIPDLSLLSDYRLSHHPICRFCPDVGTYFYEPMGLETYHYSDFLDEQDYYEAKNIAHHMPMDDISKYQVESKNIGEHALAGALRFFASGNLQNESQGEMVVQRYFEGALLTERVISRLIHKNHYKAACFNHGIYAPHGITGEVCRDNGVKVINWNVAYRKRCFIFSHGDTYHHTMLDESTEFWENMIWDKDRENEIMDYLKSRWSGSRDWIWFHEKPNEDLAQLVQETGIDLTKPIIGMLTNVMWDAQLHYRTNAFPNMLDWAVETIRYFADRSDLQLLIRIHPAEIRGGLPSRQPLLPELQKIFPRIPSNVFIIPPESQISTYAAMDRCDSVIIYGTKTGVELSSMGIPVIVGGEAWIRNKGMTLDASTPEEYFKILDRLPLEARMSAETIEKAKKYAYHFFFRRMIPLKSVIPYEGTPPYQINISSLEQLMPGSDPGLDIVCDGILNRNPFIYQAEKLGLETEYS